MINLIPFEIDFPVKVLTNKKIEISSENLDDILSRNIYYNFYEGEKNGLLKNRIPLLKSLAINIQNLILEEYPKFKILNISSFGSSLYSENPKDFDFLVIVEGNAFLLEEKNIEIEGSNKEYSVGISIKGINNFEKGEVDKKNLVSVNLQKQIQDRTLSALYYRHIPLIGFDFVDNEKLFAKNILPQVSDLIHYSYEMHYKKNTFNLTKKERAKKIMLRMYEAISYLSFLYPSCLEKKKIIYNLINKVASLNESRNVLSDVKEICKEKLRRISKKEDNALCILKNNSLKRNIVERLQKYWEAAKLPYDWIEEIFEILSQNIDSEELAIKKIKDKFGPIFKQGSKEYSKKLSTFRKKKIRNLAERITPYLQGQIIADIGGMQEDFMVEILRLNNNIKKCHVTDLRVFSTPLNNPKISFSVQPTPTSTTFEKESIDSIILNMVLHHIDNLDQVRFIKHLASRLKKGGRMILIEDTYPEKYSDISLNNNMKKFLSFSEKEKKKILYFYDWFGNTLMRNSDNLDLVCNYKTMEEWKFFLEKINLKQLYSEFVVENNKKPDLFRPKALLVFEKIK